MVIIACGARPHFWPLLCHKEEEEEETVTGKENVCARMGPEVFFQGAIMRMERKSRNWQLKREPIVLILALISPIL